MGKKARLKKLRKEESAAEQTSPLATLPKLNQKSQKVIITLLLCAAILLGIILRLSNLDISRRTPDEMVYTYQAEVIAKAGLKGTIMLVKEYNLTKDMWIYPPPTRIGYNYLLATAMKITNITDPKIGSYLSSIFSIGTLVILSLIGLRFFNPYIALFALALMSVSSMDLVIARRCWSDSILAFFGLLVIYSCCELSVNPKREIWYIPLLVGGSYCVLIKESGIVIYGLCVIWLLWIMLFKAKSIRQSSFLAILSFLSVGFSIILLINAIGGISNLLEVMKHVKEAMPTNVYAVEYQEGPWHRFLEGFWILSPISTLLAVIGMISALSGVKYVSFENDYNRFIVKGITFFIILFILITLVTPYCQNFRYISIVFAPICLMGGLGIWQIIYFIRSIAKDLSFYLAIAILISVVIVVSMNDYKRFRHVFVDSGVPDLSTKWIQEGKRI